MPLWLARTESIYAERLGATSFLGDVSGETGGGGSLVAGAGRLESAGSFLAGVWVKTVPQFFFFFF